MLDKEQSQRLSSIRFPLIVAVVFIHAYGSDVSVSGTTLGLASTNALTGFIRDLISQGLARSAVPLFFLMSGYLFFLGFQASTKHYLDKFSSRVQTLLIPFLIWNIATLLLNAAVQSLPATQAFVSGNNARIADFGLYEYANAIFGIDRPPIAYQFWFIRDLMVVVLLSPLIYFCVSRMAAVFLAILALLWVAKIWPLYIPSAPALLFFSVGAALACHRQSLFRFDAYAKPLIAVYLCVLPVHVMLLGSPASTHVEKLTIVLGAIAFLSLSKWVVRREALRHALQGLASASFFVFAAHEPLLTIFRKIAYKIVQPSSSAAVLTLYLLIPITLIILLVAVYRLGAKYLPGLTRVVSGGR
ncbi:acyltransferase [Oxalobacteraceae bacterium]|nr:acyltransferase [Oxalobacteraceae bacterium]